VGGGRKDLTGPIVVRYPREHLITMEEERTTKKTSGLRVSGEC